MPNANGSTQTDDVVVLIPVYNDWNSLTRLLREIDATLGLANLRGRIAVVDDASTITSSEEFLNQRYHYLSSVKIIRLLAGQGHQRAIVAGLAHLNKIGVGAKAIIVMDGDGEDRPMDIPRLIEELSCKQTGVVFAARIKRTESFIFRFMYLFFRLVHWLLTGISVSGGNFSAISPCVLSKLLSIPALFNHYAGTVVRSRVGFSTVPLPRGRRYAGQSHMTYIGLMVHGLSAIALSSEVVGVRLIVFFAGLAATFSVLLGVGLLEWPNFPSWMAIVNVVLILFILQGLFSSLLFVLTVLGRRSETKIAPAQGAESSIESAVCIFESNEGDRRQAHFATLEQS